MELFNKYATKQLLRWRIYWCMAYMDGWMYMRGKVISMSFANFGNLFYSEANSSTVQTSSEMRFTFLISACATSA